MSDPSSRSTSLANERLAAALFSQPGTNLRPLVAEDSAVVSALIWEPILTRDPSAVAQLDKTSEQLRQAMATSSAVVAVLDVDGRAEGALWVRAISSPPAVVFYIEELVLAPRFRQIGRGKQLLERLERAARDSGAVGLSLDFVAHNARVEHLYARAGYGVIGLDLRRLGEPATGGAAASGGVTRCSNARELEAVVRRIVAERTLSRFEYPEPRLEQVRELLREALNSPRHFVLLAEARDQATPGYVVVQLEQSRLTGAPIIVVQALGGCADLGGGERAQRLLANAFARGAEFGLAGPMFLTLWEPAAELLSGLTHDAFQVVRHKMYRALTKA